MTAPTLTGQDIAEAQGAVRGLLERVLASTGVTGNEYVLLRVLSQRGGSIASAREFLVSQRQLNLDAAAADALIQSLTDRGLAIDDEDEVVLTDLGRATYDQLVTAVTDVTQRLYGPMDPDDLAVAHHVLAEVTRRAATIGTI